MMRIVHVVPAYLPATAWGGPVFSTSALVRAAVRAGHKVCVLTTDSADPETGARLSRQANPTFFADGYDVYYMPRSFGQSGSWALLRALPGHLGRADLVHLSMTYSFPTLPTLLLCRIMGKPVVWSPRGAIQATVDWADAPRKRVKTAFERLAGVLAPRDTLLHVTAPSEAEVTARRMPGLESVIIPNAVAVPESPPVRRYRPDGRLRLLFMSRLHPKKGIDMLIEVLAALPAHVTLAVAGSGSPAFEAALNGRVAELGLDERVTFLGQLDGTAKQAAFAEADALILPTHSENFGIAVAEGMAQGLPVITTTAAPWSGIESRGCGAWIPPKAEALRMAIEALDAHDAAGLAAMGARGHKWMAESFSEAGVDARMMAIYDQLLQQRQT